VGKMGCSKIIRQLFIDLKKPVAEKYMLYSTLIGFAIPANIEIILKMCQKEAGIQFHKGKQSSGACTIRIFVAWR
jgi:hypothetical protein